MASVGHGTDDVRPGVEDVATGKDLGHRGLPMGVGHDLAPFVGDGPAQVLRYEGQIHGLADGRDEHVRLQGVHLVLNGNRSGPFPRALVHHAGFDILHGHHPAVTVLHDLHGQGLGKEHHAFVQGLAFLLVGGGHVLHASPVHHIGLLGAQAERGAAGIHGHIAAPYDHHAFAHLHGLSQVHPFEELNGLPNPPGVLSGDAEGPGLVVPHADEHGVKLFHELLEGHIGAHPGVEPEVHPQRQDVPDFLVQGFLGEPVPGDPDPHHAAGHRERLKDGNLVALEPQVVGCGEAGRARPYDGHPLAGGGGNLGLEHAAVIVNLAGGKALEEADLDGVSAVLVHAGGFAAVGAHDSADLGEGIGAEHDAQGLFVVAAGDGGDVLRNVHLGGATLDAEPAAQAPLGLQNGLFLGEAQQHPVKVVFPLVGVAFRHFYAFVHQQGGLGLGAPAAAVVAPVVGHENEIVAILGYQQVIAAEFQGSGGTNIHALAAEAAPSVVHPWAEGGAAGAVGHALHLHHLNGLAIADFGAVAAADAQVQVVGVQAPFPVGGFLLLKGEPHGMGLFHQKPQGGKGIEQIFDFRCHGFTYRSMSGGHTSRENMKGATSATRAPFSRSSSTRMPWVMLGPRT